MAGYSYSEVNRLDTPHSYMYTPFEGISFLSTFVETRLAAITSIEQRIEEKYPGSLAPVPISSAPSSLLLPIQMQLSAFLIDLINSSRPGEMPSPQKEPVETRDLLFHLLHQLMQAEPDHESAIWLNHLCRWFEVRKVISTRYPHPRRRGIGESRDLQLYGLAALALSLALPHYDNYKHLNALLKLDDLLCSVTGEVSADRVAAVATCFAIKNELKTIELLMGRSGIKQ